MDHGYVAVQWCEKGTMRRFCKNAVTVDGEIKGRACVQSFWLAKPLGFGLRSSHWLPED